MDGIEIRGIASEMYAPKTAPLRHSMRDKTIEMMKDAKIEFSMLTTGCEISDKEKNLDVMDEVFDYIDLAKWCGCKNVRVMAERTPDRSREIDLDYTLAIYKDILDYAIDKDVNPLMETNGIFADTRVMADFMEATGRSNAGVLWDIHHPYRYMKETPEVTYSNLDGLIKYVHVKDSVMENGQTKYRMLGYGDVPILDCMKALTKDGYDGYVSLEWLKRWTPDLQEPGIVFSHFAFYMRYLLEQV